MLSFWSVLRGRIAPIALERTAVGRVFCGFSLTKCFLSLEILLFGAVILFIDVEIQCDGHCAGTEACSLSVYRIFLI